MEPIKISVDVNVKISESTQAFVRSLFSCTQIAQPLPSATQVARSVEIETQTVPTQPAASVPTPEPAKPAPSAPAAPAPRTPATGPAHNLDELRKMLASKVNSHREAIKNKLTAYNAKSLTTLGKEHYDDMYNFLESL